MTAQTWQKSRRCDTSACVEVADLGEEVGVRNSTDPEVQLDLPFGAFEGLRLDILDGLFQYPEREPAA